MNSTPFAASGLLEPLPDLAAWTEYFRSAEIAVLRETADALEALRANEDLADANSIGEMIAGDPLMTLKVLAYASEHRGQQVVTGAETVTAALVMMGISPFFRAFAPQQSVEDRLALQPAALAGWTRVLRRAHRGADFALAFAIHRTDPNAASIHAATLLHEFAEMLLWLHAPALALRVQQALDDDAGLRSSAAQRAVLNIELADLQQALIAVWQLPSLLHQTQGEPQAGQAGARTVALAARLARHTAAGWDNAAIPDDIAEIALLLNLSPAATLHLARDIEPD
ncbi:MAG: HDOD domain-containing protein [Caldimonas sp.]